MPWATQNLAAQDGVQIERGMKACVDQKCSAGHSIAGKGNQKGALDDVGSRLTWTNPRVADESGGDDEEDEGRTEPPMRAYPNLAKEDRDARVADVARLKKK